MIWLAIFLASLILVGGYRHIALHRHWFDVPNQRSSHTEIVPRGAGIVLAVLVSAIAIALSWQAGQSAIAIGFSLGMIVALAGWRDDLRGLSARKRLLIYGVACLGAVAVVEGRNDFGAMALFITGLTVLGMLWWVNLYNFMDGINGIAALEGIFICAAAYVLSDSAAAIPETRKIYLLVIVALIGFLPWNFPKARVFMGDAGSAFLGFFIGVIALWSIAAGAMNIWQWLLLGGVFIVDSSYTLFVRIVTGQRWHEAHRSHMYQRLADRYQSHAAADCILMSINTIWLLPLAWSAGHYSTYTVGILAAGYLPIWAACLWMRAGMDQRVLRT